MCIRDRDFSTPLRIAQEDQEILERYNDCLLYTSKNIKKIVPDFTINEEVGLFMHVACSINRIKSGEGFLKNIHKEGILLHNKKLYHSLKDILAELEAAMNFTFNDDELATIIEIIK